MASPNTLIITSAVGITPPTIYAGGTKHWRNKHGELHREDGPAVEWFDGDVEYYINGKFHRTDGPAVEWASRTRYYINGKLHRLDGPATTDEFLVSMYFVNGVRYNPGSEYNAAVDHWLSYKEVTQEQIEEQIGNFRIVGW